MSLPVKDLRKQVFLGFRKGVLFPVSSKSWVGPGTGKVCIVCELPIERTDIEHEVDGPRGAVAAHQLCYTVWHQMSEDRGGPH